ncbi:flagellar biosynthesis; hook protein [Xenorhabdus bovienii str. Jollieti]|uniref:Flagellar hook protein FlgE n=1 Tax=Xenorhabdus bovienii (strain SS-2004) TaxID=406818 RepID=D3V2W4_XENBS|nr:flagellar hook protein FlgE [Xenorhabdus bovienii]CBJ81079.1 flagellar biosynthesis; hook protein [Xenorhabdus bovienii SS-2004]CDH26939.1 flagellar biosynthesis; hook protein [Xenorhabdus bovienii str. Jollieti]
MAFSQAVSGLNAAASNLDVIGNNIANSATFGFKSSSAAFADVFSGSDVGLGVKVSGMVKNFKDGSTTTTSRQLDMAITQGGFFRMLDSNGSTFYSRNGQFNMDSDRNLINMQGMKLTGYPAVQGANGPEIQKGAAPGPISIPRDMLDAKATTNVTMTANLNSMNKKVDINPFNPSNKDSFNYSSGLSVYDSLGNEHNINVFFVKTNDNEWDIYAQDTSVPGSDHQKLNDKKVVEKEGESKSVLFSGNGKIIGNNNAFAFDMPGLNGSIGAPITIDFNNSKQQSISQDSISNQQQNGYAAGSFTNYRVDSDGKIHGLYSNQQTQVLGQVVLANFSNPEGLAAQGDNVWVETGASGSPIVGTAGSGNFGKLISGALEASNVDMSQELVNMIVAQRNYQSNAQTIKTQDQILQTLVSMR